MDLYNGKKVFDKDIPQQTIKDYLQDPMLWVNKHFGVLLVVSLLVVL